MVDKKRRGFFNEFFVKNTVRFVADTYDSYKKAKGDLEYFESYETAYTLIAENLPFIEDEAKRLNITTEGKSKLEIVKEIYDKNKDFMAGKTS